MSDALVSMHGVYKAFGGVHAVEDVTLAVHAGEVLALLGHNGAGESTLMKLLAGAHALDAGQIRLFLISHDMPDVFALSDRLCVMKNGRTVGSYRTADVDEDGVLEMIIAGRLPVGVTPCTRMEV